MASPSKQPNALLDLLLTVVLPSWALSKLSEPGMPGPFWALVIASLLPLGYGLWCWWSKTGLNLFSVIGLVAVILTGGLGLLNLSAFWFGLKEAAVPALIGVAFPLSHRWGRRLIDSIFFAPHVINERALRDALDTPSKAMAFEGILYSASKGLGASMVISGLLNLPLALWLIGSQEPGSEGYVKALGTMNWVSFVGIGVPLLAAMALVMIRFLRQTCALTGLPREVLLHQPRKVTREV